MHKHGTPVGDLQWRMRLGHQNMLAYLHCCAFLSWLSFTLDLRVPYNAEAIRQYTKPLIILEDVCHRHLTDVIVHSNGHLP